MARITMFTPDQLDPELRARSRADERTPLDLGLTRIFGHQPAMAAGLGAFSAALKANRTLPERLIELVRLRVAFHNQCRSCMAIRYGELFATNHLALDDAFHDRLKELFTEPEIVDLGLNVALFVGIGRLSATCDMVERHKVLNNRGQTTFKSFYQEGHGQLHQPSVIIACPCGVLCAACLCGRPACPCSTRRFSIAATSCVKRSLPRQ
jgi:alkylhydroperoxidase family enzyme